MIKKFLLNIIKNEESKDCEKAQYLSFLLKISNYFYWNFSKEGIYIIKINFKKKSNIVC